LRLPEGASARALVSLLVVLGVAAIFVFLIPRALASSGRPLSVGVVVRADWDLTEAERDRVFDKLAAARVGWVRLQACWCEGHSDLVTRNIAAAHRRGLRVLLTLWGSPGPELAAVPTETSSVAAYAARTYDADAWEIWNEPDYRLFWLGTPEQYGRLARAAYPALHATGRPVLLAGLAHNDPRFLRRVLRAGARFDAVALHPYPRPHGATPEQALRQLDPIHRLVPRAPVWITELGWSTYAGGVTEARQAAYVSRTLRLVRERYGYVRTLFFYTERDDQRATWLGRLGLLRRDLTPKPAFTALAEGARQA
jgi:hypothetical protein